jgi:cytochrome c-type biogenesis protein
MDLDFTLIENASLLAFALVFLGGILTSIGPCNVAMIPLVVGYVGGSRDLPRARAFSLSLMFALGLALTFMLLGLAAALIGGLVGASTTWWYYLVAFVCFVIGLNMLGLIHIEMPSLAGRIARKRVTLKGVPGALALGLVSGLVASQCATPVLAAILTYVMAKGALALWRGVVVRLCPWARRADRAGRDVHRHPETVAGIRSLERSAGESCRA